VLIQPTTSRRADATTSLRGKLRAPAYSEALRSPVKVSQRSLQAQLGMYVQLKRYATGIFLRQGSQQNPLMGRWQTVITIHCARVSGQCEQIITHLLICRNDPVLRFSEDCSRLFRMPYQNPTRAPSALIHTSAPLLAKTIRTKKPIFHTENFGSLS